MYLTNFMTLKRMTLNLLILKVQFAILCDSSILLHSLLEKLIRKHPNFKL